MECLLKGVRIKMKIDDVIVRQSNTHDKGVFAKWNFVMMQEPERFVHHSYDSNTGAKPFCDVAKRDINKDEEITTEHLHAV